MNRTLLLILCDFLLLTLLALTKWETAEPERPVTATAEIEAGEGAATVADDIVSLMQQTLEEQAAAQAELEAEQARLAEQKAAETAALEAQLEERRGALRAAAAEIARRDNALSQMERQQQEISEDLRMTQQEAVRQADRLTQKLDERSREAEASRARLEQLQRDLEAREAEARERAAEVERLAAEQADARAQIENLNVAVQVAEQEKVLLRETADTFREQAQIEREERMRVQETTVQLAEGVGALAAKSAEITAEIRDNRPINANTLFSDFLINRVPTTFSAERPALFGNTAERSDRTRTILVSDGTTTFAVMHVEASPFNFTEPPSDWDRIEVQLTRDGAVVEPPEIRFLARDPRVVALPLTDAQAASLGVRIYELATDPFRFPDAVLINNGGQGYGEVPFKLEANLPGYVRMDNRLLRRLVGDFTPSQGDLVLSKTGRLLGIMVTGDLCALLDDLSAQAIFNTGDTRSQNEAEILESLRDRYTHNRPAGPRGPR
jgi:hypothetical protein